MKGLIFIYFLPFVIASVARQSRRYASPIGKFARHDYEIATSFLLAMTSLLKPSIR